jgi:hypothetical protein
MSFLSPLFLAGAAAAAIPIVLHLLKRQPEPRVKFAAVKLLRRAPIEHTRKRHLRELLLLALRVATLLLLAVAFARPFFASGAAAAASGVTIVALDTSASLSAPATFERARRLAREAAVRASSGDQVGVVLFADTADLVVKPTVDRAAALAAVDAAAPGFGATRYRAALGAAAQALEGRGGTIVLVSDLQDSGWDAGDRVAISDSARVQIVDVGAPPPNLAVTALRADADGIVATVRHTGGSTAREAHLRLTVDGRSAGDAVLSIAPNQSADARFPRPSAGASAMVAVEDREGLQADNVRYVVLAAASRPSLTIITASGDLGRDAFYVQQALEAPAGNGPRFDVVGVAGAQLSAPPANRLGTTAAVALLSTRGLERGARERLAEYVRRGGGLLIAAGPDIDGDVVSDLLGTGSGFRIAAAKDSGAPSRRLIPADGRHPVFQAFQGNAAALGLVVFERIAAVAGSECQTLARFSTGEAGLIECAAGEGRILVLASDVNNRWNDFPRHATFVPFMHEAMQYLAGRRPGGNEYVIGDVPRGVMPVPGIIDVSGDLSGGEPRSRLAAVNIDPRESDPTRMSPDDFQSTVTRLKEAAQPATRLETRQQEERQHLWQYVLLLTILTLAAEGLVASRTA